MTDGNSSRIFMINQTDESHRFGVGRYISEMVLEAKERLDGFEMVVVTIGTPQINRVYIKNVKNIQYIDIPRQFNGQENPPNALSKQFSLAVFCILADLFEFSDTDIFHFNSNIQYFLLRQIKENTRTKIIYAIHVSLWRVFYKNDKQRFLSLWKNPDEKSREIMNIKAEAKNCELADFIICLTEGMACDVEQFYEIPKNKIKVIANGLSNRQTQDSSNDSEALIAEMGIPKNTFKFLYVGRLNQQKGIERLFEAYISLLKKIEIPLVLIVVGDGPLRIVLENMAIKNEVKVFFTGYVEPEKVPGYYRLADALVFPTLNEQSSYVALEAMKYKLPMVLSDINAFKHFENQISCLKVEVGGISGPLEKAMKLLVKDKNLRTRLSENAFALFLGGYTAEVMFRNTYEIENPRT